MDRLLSSDAYLNLRCSLGLETLFGQLIRGFFTSHRIKSHDKKAMVEFVNHHLPNTNLKKVNSCMLAQLRTIIDFCTTQRRKI